MNHSPLQSGRSSMYSACYQLTAWFLWGMEFIIGGRLSFRSGSGQASLVSGRHPLGTFIVFHYGYFTCTPIIQHWAASDRHWLISDSWLVCLLVVELSLLCWMFFQHRIPLAINISACLSPCPPRLQSVIHQWAKPLIPTPFPHKVYHCTHCQQLCLSGCFFIYCFFFFCPFFFLRQDFAM
jgi:hypothetical protein